MTGKGLNPEPKSFLACVNGVIPPAAGVSSSSAFVVASALATLKVHEVVLTKKELAALCTTCESVPCRVDIALQICVRSTPAVLIHCLLV